MKRLVRNFAINILLFINFFRLLIPLIMYISNSTYRNTIGLDLTRQKKYKKGNLLNNFYLTLFHYSFRNINYYRINSCSKLMGLIFRNLFPLKLNLEISGKIDGGLMVYHGQSSEIHPFSAGKNFTIYQNVTVGRNKDHCDSNGIDFPIFGDNVILYSGCVVAGGIHIGDNVEIGAMLLF